MDWHLSSNRAWTPSRLVPRGRGTKATLNLSAIRKQGKQLPRLRRIVGRVATDVVDDQRRRVVIITHLSSAVRNRSEVALRLLQLCLVCH